MRGDKRCFLCIRRVHRDLMVAEKCIYKRQHAIPGRRFDNMIYAGQREAILRTRVIKIRIVYAYSPFAPLLRNYHYISKPFWVSDFSNKPNLQKVIYFSLDNLMAIRVKAPYSLLTGRVDGRTFNLWEACTGFIPVMSEWV